MNLVTPTQEVTWAELEHLADDAAQRGLLSQQVGGVKKVTTFMPVIHYGLGKGTNIDWFGTKPLSYNGKSLLAPVPEAVLSPQHNLAVATGVHITAQRTFNIGGPPSAVTAGGVDSSTVAVASTATVFATTKFIVAFDATATYSTALARVTGDYTVTDALIDSWTVEIMRRFGVGNSTSNAANSLYAMLSGFSLDFGANAFSMTVRSRTDFTGS